MVDENSIGKLLKDAREAKNISLEDIASKTKININVLKALECNDLDSLPNITYVRGFVANFAKTVGLDPNLAKTALASTYETRQTTGTKADETIMEAPITAPTNQSSEETTQTTKNIDEDVIKEETFALIKHFLNKKVIFIVAGLAILVVVISGVSTFFNQITNEDTVTSEPIKSQIEAQPQISENTKTEPVKQTPPQEDLNLKSEDANILEMDTNIKTSQASSKDEKVIKEITPEVKIKKVEPPKKVAEVIEKPAPKEVKKISKLKDGELPFKKFYSAPKKLYEVLKDSQEAKNSDLLPNNIKSAYITGKQNIYINAVDGDTWVSYKSDDKPIRRFVLKQGRRLLIRGEIIQIFMGNYNAVRVFYNNELVSAKTKSGVKSLIFPPSASENFELPLFPSYQGILYTAKDYKSKMATE